HRSLDEHPTPIVRISPFPFPRDVGSSINRVFRNAAHSWKQRRIARMETDARKLPSGPCGLLPGFPTDTRTGQRSRALTVVFPRNTEAHGKGPTAKIEQ